jgi:hypothetical protein
MQFSDNRILAAGESDGAAPACPRRKIDRCRARQIPPRLARECAARSARACKRLQVRRQGLSGHSSGSSQTDRGRAAHHTCNDRSCNSPQGACSTVCHSTPRWSGSLLDHSSSQGLRSTRAHDRQLVLCRLAIVGSQHTQPTQLPGLLPAAAPAAVVSLPLPAKMPRCWSSPHLTCFLRLVLAAVRARVQTAYQQPE